MKKIIAIIGARPQFIKHAPIELACRKKGIELKTIHTGQHYDDNMSSVFFEQLEMNIPSHMLHIGSHSHGKQTGLMMEKIEPILVAEKPDAILVYGDTNSTLAGALVSSKLHIPVIHVEAGLRSFNKKMPEEVNRILTDHISNVLFAPTQQAIHNLTKEGITQNVYHTGDIMYDMLHIAQEHHIIQPTFDHQAYYLATLHRPYNTDQKERLIHIFDVLNDLTHPVKCPLHPRTRHKAQQYEVNLADYANIQFMEPVGYFDNLNLMFNARAVLTDSGGMQKEAYWLKRKCVTIRTETEWVETLEGGWNVLVFEKLSRIKTLVEREVGTYQEQIYGNGQSRWNILDIILKNV